MTRPYQEHQDTPLWRALEGALRELEANRELTVATAPDYVIGYLCQELVARGVVAASPGPQRDHPGRDEPG